MINRVVLVGRITKEVALRKTQSGRSVASFTIACNRRFQSPNGEREADFINCVAWGQTADYMAQYITKGTLIGVEGRIQTRNYDDANGRRVYVTEVVCDSVQRLESRNSSEQRSNSVSQQSAPIQDSYFADAPSYDDFNVGPSLDISSDDLPF